MLHSKIAIKSKSNQVMFQTDLLELIMNITCVHFCDDSCCQLLQKTRRGNMKITCLLLNPPTRVTDCNLIGTHQYFCCICLVHAYLLNLDLVKP